MSDGPGGYGALGGSPFGAPGMTGWKAWDRYAGAQQQQAESMAAQAQAMANMVMRKRAEAERLEAWRADFARDMEAFAREQGALAVTRTKRAALALAAASVAYLGVCLWVAEMSAR